MIRSVLVLFVLMVVKVLATPLNTIPTSNPRTVSATSAVISEKDCVWQGGECALKEHCAPKDTASLPLCPKQSHLGVVCCYNL